jgi:phenylpropionate dioxygenase-like ring-hydroxylating dioxygenase large terminal subunit
VTQTTPAPGEAREYGPSLREQLLADPTPAPAALLEESYTFRGDDDIPFAVYTSTDYALAEEHHMWSKVWQWACHVDHIPKAGRYYVYDVGGHSALVVRTESGEIKAYANACMHRGTQLKPPGTCGLSRELRCPFHGWRWALDGTFIERPGAWDFPHVTDESHRLVELPVDVWEGFVFVNFDRDAAPLRDHLGVLPRHWADWGLADRYIETHVHKRLPCNWKAAAEAFLEAYHVRETHHTGKLGDEVTTQYDVFGDNVSRFIHTTTMNSPLREPPLTEAELFARQSGRRGLGADKVLPEGMRARDYYAKVIQEEFAVKYGRDFSHLSESMTLDSIEYFLFPNAFFFPGLQLSMVYRFRPDPASVDFSWFDLLIMRPRPAKGKAPAPADVLELDVADSYTLAQGLGGLGMVYDQDTANMAAQTRGFRSSYKRGQTLGNYQEVRARHLEQRVRDYVGAWPTD